MLAFGGQGTCPVALNDLQLPAESLLATEGAGFEIMVSTEAEGKVRAARFALESVGARLKSRCVMPPSVRTEENR